MSCTGFGQGSSLRRTLQSIASPEKTFTLPPWAEDVAEVLALAPSPVQAEKIPTLKFHEVERYLDIYADEEHVPILDTVEFDSHA